MKKYILYLLLIVGLLSISSNTYCAFPIYNNQSLSRIEKNKERADKPLKDEKTKKQKGPNINGALSMSFGIASVVFFPPLCIPAIILGAISLTKKEPKQGYAITGLITGGLSLMVILAIIAILIVAI